MDPSIGTNITESKMIVRSFNKFLLIFLQHHSIGDFNLRLDIILLYDSGCHFGGRVFIEQLGIECIDAVDVDVAVALEPGTGVDVAVGVGNTSSPVKRKMTRPPDPSAT